MTEEWQRSSHCAEGNSCVYVAAATGTAPGSTGPGFVLVTGSPGGPGGGPAARVVRVGDAAWTALLDAVKGRQL
ncbi:DUF397 domain-containing protein [Streptomyces sp. NPDC058613]|uniref:DUF397 domain-containing protein n=1 Tax=Streptomyces sp. NPDC058613 TaxID=3346556 RepID=UPI0036548AA8